MARYRVKGGTQGYVCMAHAGEGTELKCALLQDRVCAKPQTNEGPN